MVSGPQSAASRRAGPIRLVAVVHRSVVGGTEVCFERVVTALAADPRFVVCAAYPRQGDRVESWDGITEHIPYDAGVLPDTFDFNAYRGWERRRHGARRVFESDVARFRPDVIVSFTSVLTSPVEVAQRLGVPAIAYVREFVHPAVVRRWLWRHLAARADRLIAVSSEVAQALEPFAPGRVRAIHDGVPLPGVQHAAGWPPSAQVVGFYGGFDERKGGEVFVRMAAIVQRDLPSVRFVFNGVATAEQAKSREALRRLAADLGLPGDVMRFDGSGAFGPTFGGNSVVVMPSVREGLGLVALDAMAHGVPVVASRTGGLTDVVDDGMTGVLVPVGDVEGFAAAVAGIVSDPTANTAMGAAARVRVEEQFSVGDAVSGLVGVVHEVVRGGNR